MLFLRPSFATLSSEFAAADLEMISELNASGQLSFFARRGASSRLKSLSHCQMGKGELEMADDTLDLLKDLIETCKDGETGYVHAAGVAEDPQLKAYFTEQSLERARFGKELRAEAERLGDKPDASGSVSAVLHRVWFETKATVGLGDQSTLNSVEQGEDRAKKDYEKALSSQLPDACAPFSSARQKALLRPMTMFATCATGWRSRERK
jgi:uncharacterized protein (TIGR02284 family)